MRYLSDICSLAHLRQHSLFVDNRLVDKLPLPAVLKRASGSAIAALKLLSLGQARVVVHVNTSLYPSTMIRDLPIMVAARLRGFPVLLQVHGGRLSNLRRGSAPFRVARWMFHTASTLGIHPGPQWREFEEAGYRDKMRRMHNAVPRSLRAGPADPSTAHLIFLGRLTESKGIRELVDVVLRLCSEGHLNLRLTVAGDGPLLAELKERIATSPWSDNVEITGFLSGSALQEALDEASCFVLPSRHQEGFPFSFLECGERGMACLVTRDSAIAELFEPGIDFLPLDLDRGGVDHLYHQVGRLVSDADLRARLGRTLQTKIRASFTLEALSQSYRDLYDQISSEDATRPAQTRP